MLNEFSTHFIFGIFHIHNSLIKKKVCTEYLAQINACYVSSQLTQVSAVGVVSTYAQLFGNQFSFTCLINI